MVVILLSLILDLGTGHSSSLLHFISVVAARLEELNHGQDAIFILHIFYQVMCPTVGNTLVGEDDLTPDIVMVQGKEHFSFQLVYYLRIIVQRVWYQEFRVMFSTINVRIAHMCKHSQVLGMSGNSATEDNLLHQGPVGGDGVQFCYQVGGALEGCAVESFVHKIGCNAFILLGNSHMNGLDKLMLRMDRLGRRVSGGIEQGPEGLGNLELSQIVCHLKP